MDEIERKSKVEAGKAQLLKFRKKKAKAARKKKGDATGGESEPDRTENSLSLVTTSQGPSDGDVAALGGPDIPRSLSPLPLDPDCFLDKFSKKEVDELLESDVKEVLAQQTEDISNLLLESEPSFVSGAAQLSFHKESTPNGEEDKAGAAQTEFGSSGMWQSYQIQQLQAEVDTLRVQKIEIDEQKDTEVNVLREEIDQLRIQRDSVQTTGMQLSLQRIEALQEEIQTWEEKVNTINLNFQQVIKEKGAMFQESSAKQAALQNQVTQLEEACGEIKAQFEQKESELSQITEENQLLMEKLSTQKSTFDLAYSEQVKQIQANYESSQQQLQLVYEGEMKRLQERVRGLETEVAGREGTLSVAAASDVKVRELEAELERLQGRLRDENPIAAVEESKMEALMMEHGVEVQELIRKHHFEMETREEEWKRQLDENTAVHVRQMEEFKAALQEDVNMKVQGLYGQLQGSLSEAHAALETERKQSAALLEEIERYKRTLVDVEEYRDDFEETLDQERKLKAEQMETNGRLLEQNKALSASVQSLNGEYMRVAERLALIEDELAAEKQMLERMTEARETDGERVAQLEAELESRRDEEVKLRDEFRGLLLERDGRVDELQQENEALRRCDVVAGETQEEVMKERKQSALLLNEIERYKRTLANAEESQEDLKEILGQERKLKAEQVETNGRLLEQNKTLSASVQTLNEEYKRLSEGLALVEDELAGEKQALERMTEERERNVERVAQLEADLERRRDEEAELRDEFDGLLQERDSRVDELRRENETLQRHDVIADETREEATEELKKSFGREILCLRRERDALKEQLEKQEDASRTFASVIIEKERLEKALNDYRSQLGAKQKERESLEGDLAREKAALEIQLIEKERLEQLIKAKDSLEKEISKQKENLQTDLEEIENRLKEKSNELVLQKTRYERSLTEKEDELSSVKVAMEVRETEVKEEHDRQIVDVRERMTAKGAKELEVLRGNLTERHHGEMEDLSGRHQKRVDGLKEEHKRKMAELKVEVERDIRNQMDAKKRQEIVTVKEVHEREQARAVEVALQKQQREHELAIEALKRKARTQFQKEKDKLVSDLTQAHQMETELLGEGHDEDQSQQLELLREQYDARMTALKEDYETQMNEMKENHSAEMESHDLHSQREMASKVDAMERKRDADVEKKVAEMREEHSQTVKGLKEMYEEKKHEALLELTEQRDRSVEELKSAVGRKHAEDLEAAVERVASRCRLETEKAAEMHGEEVERLQRESEEFIRSVKELHGEEMENLRRELTEERRSALDELHTDMERRMTEAVQQIEERHLRDVERMQTEREQLIAEMAEAEKSWKDKLSVIEEEHSIRLSELRLEFSGEKVAWEEEREKLEETIATAERMQAEREREAEREQLRLRNEIMVETEKSWKAKLSVVEEKHIVRLSEMREDFTEQLVALKDRHVEDLQEAVAEAEMRYLERELEGDARFVELKEEYDAARLAREKKCSRDMANLEATLRDDFAKERADVTAAWKEEHSKRVREIQEKHREDMERVRQRAIRDRDEFEREKATMRETHLRELKKTGDRSASAEARRARDAATENLTRSLTEITSRFALQEEELRMQHSQELEKSRLEWSRRVTALENAASDAAKEFSVRLDDLRASLEAEREETVCRREEELKEKYEDEMRGGLAQLKKEQMVKFRSMTDQLVAEQETELERVRQESAVALEEEKVRRGKELAEALEEEETRHRVEMEEEISRFQRDLDDEKARHQRELREALLVRTAENQKVVEEYKASYQELAESLEEKKSEHERQWETESERNQNELALELARIQKESEDKHARLQSEFEEALKEKVSHHQKEVEEPLKDEVDWLKSQLEEGRLKAVEELRQANETAAEEFQKMEATQAQDVATLREEWESEKAELIERMKCSLEEEKSSVILRHKAELDEVLENFEKRLEMAKAAKDEMHETRMRRLAETGSSKIADVEERLRVEIAAMETELETQAAAMRLAEAKWGEEKALAASEMRKEMGDLEKCLRERIRQGDERVDEALVAAEKMETQLKEANEEKKRLATGLDESNRKIEGSSSHYERILKRKDGELEELDNTVAIQQRELEKATRFVDRLLTALRQIVGAASAVEEAVSKPLTNEESTASENTTNTVSLQTDEGVCDTSRLSFTDTMLASTLFEASRAVLAEEDDGDGTIGDLEAVIDGRVAEAENVAGRLNEALVRFVEMLKEANERAVVTGEEKVAIMAKHTEELQSLATEREELLGRISDLEAEMDERVKAVASERDGEAEKRRAAEEKIRELDSAHEELIEKMETVLEEIKGSGVDELREQLKVEQDERVRLANELEEREREMATATAMPPSFSTAPVDFDESLMEEQDDSRRRFSVVEFDQLKLQVVQFQEQFAVVESSLTQLRSERDELVQKLNHANVELKSFQQKLDDEKREKADLERNLPRQMRLVRLQLEAKDIGLARERRRWLGDVVSSESDLASNLAVVDDMCSEKEAMFDRLRLQFDVEEGGEAAETKATEWENECEALRRRERELLEVVADYDRHVKQRDELVRDLETAKATLTEQLRTKDETIERLKQSTDGERNSQLGISRLMDEVESVKEELVLTRRQLGLKEAESLEFGSKATELGERLRLWAVTEIVYQRQIAVLTEELEVERGKASRRGVELDDAVEAIGERERQLDQMQKQLENTMTDRKRFEDERRRLKETEDQFIAYRRDVLGMLGEDGATENELERLRATLMAHNTAIIQYENSQRSKEDVLKNLQSRLTAETGALSDVEHRFSAYRRRVLDLLGDDGVENELEALGCLLESKQNVIDQIQSQLNQAVDLQKKNREVASDKEMISRLESHLGSQGSNEELVGELQERLAEEMDTSAEVESRFSAYRRSVLGLLGDDVVEENEMEALQQLLASKQQIISQLQSRVNQAIGALQTRSRDLKAAQEESRQCREGMKEGEEELVRLRKRLEEMEIRLTSGRKENESFEIDDDVIERLGVEVARCLQLDCGLVDLLKIQFNDGGDGETAEDCNGSSIDLSAEKDGEDFSSAVEELARNVHSTAMEVKLLSENIQARSDGVRSDGSFDVSLSDQIRKVYDLLRTVQTEAYENTSQIIGKIKLLSSQQDMSGIVEALQKALQADRSQSSQQLHQFQSALEAMKASLAEEVKQADDVRQAYAHERTKVRELEAELVKERGHLDDFQAALQAEELKVATFKTETADAGRELRRLAERLESKQKIADRLEAALAEERARVDGLEDDLAAERERRRKTSETLQRECESSGELSRLLESERSSRKATESRLKAHGAQLNEWKVQLTAGRDSVASLESALEGSRRDVEKLSREVERMRRETNLLVRARRILETEKEDAEAAWAETKRRLTDVEQLFEESRIENSRLDGDLDSARQNLAALQRLEEERAGERTREREAEMAKELERATERERRRLREEERRVERELEKGREVQRMAERRRERDREAEREAEREREADARREWRLREAELRRRIGELERRMKESSPAFVDDNTRALLLDMRAKIEKLTEEKSELHRQLVALEEAANAYRQRDGESTEGKLLELESVIASQREEVERLRLDERKISNEARCFYDFFVRTEGLRRSLAYQKRFLLVRLGGFQDCEKATLALLSTMGANDDKTMLSRSRFVRRRFRAGILAVVAIVRFRKQATKWHRFGYPPMRSVVKRHPMYRPGKGRHMFDDYPPLLRSTASRRGNTSEISISAYSRRLEEATGRQTWLVDS